MPLKGPAAEVCLDFDVFIGLCGKGFLVRVCEELLEMGVDGGDREDGGG